MTERAKLWAQFAAAALSGNLSRSDSPSGQFEMDVVIAAQVADLMLAEYEKRFGGVED